MSVKTVLRGVCLPTVLALAFASTFSQGVAANTMPQPVKEGLEVNLTGEASQLVANDRAELRFFAKVDAEDAKAASRAVIERTNKALDTLKARDLKTALESIETTDLSVMPRYTATTETNAAKIDRWEATSRVVVRVKSLDRVSDVMEALGGTLDFEGVGFSISSEKRRTLEGELLSQATQALTAKLAKLAQTLGVSSDRVKLKKLDTEMGFPGGIRYYAMPRMMKNVRAADAAPQVEAGSSEVTVRVSGQALLMP